MALIDKIYEHLKTKKKYNTLELKYRVKCEELEQKIIEYDLEKRIRIIERKKYEDEINKLNDKIIKMKEKNKKRG